MGRMTVDTAALRAQWEAIREQQGPEAFAIVAHVGDGIALLDALDVLTAALQWYADERNYDEIGRPGVYVPGSTAGGFVQDPDWDTDDGWRAERALAAALATVSAEGDRRDG